jgi:nitrate reductase NapE component
MDVFGIPVADGVEATFWAAALFGTVFFLLRMGMWLVGGMDAPGADADAPDVDLGDAEFEVEVADGAEAGVDAHDLDASGADLDHGGEHQHDSDASFKLLTIHGLTGGVMMFGWGGLVAYSQFEMSLWPSLSVALGCAFGMMVLSAWLFQLALGLQAPGDAFDIREVLGLRATVYLRIPAEGRGKITVNVRGIERELDAVSEDRVELDSFTQVEIARLVQGEVVSVRERIK